MPSNWFWQMVHTSSSTCNQPTGGRTSIINRARQGWVQKIIKKTFHFQIATGRHFFTLIFNVVVGFSGASAAPATAGGSAGELDPAIEDAVDEAGILQFGAFLQGRKGRWCAGG